MNHWIIFGIAFVAYIALNFHLTMGCMIASKHKPLTKSQFIIALLLGCPIALFVYISAGIEIIMGKAK